MPHPPLRDGYHPRVLALALTAAALLAGLFGAPIASREPRSAALRAKSTGTFAIPSQLVAQVEGFPVSQLVAAALAAHEGASPAVKVTPPERLPAHNPQFTMAGKPGIVFVGGEYCPFCSSERWSLVMVLAKFGVFTGLKGTTSSATDTDPSSPSFSFYGSTYSSSVVAFVGDEAYTNGMDPATGGYATLQPPTLQEMALMSRYDVPPYTPSGATGSIPFVYVSGRYVITGTQWDPSGLSGLSWPKAAEMLVSGKSVASREALGVAGYLVGDICAITDGQPVAVCSQVPSSLVGISTTP